MPKSSNQKLKLIYLMKILLERTDETHSITMPEIIEALAAYDISAERKSLYNDIENLRVYGLDVIGTQEDRTYSYHIGNRQFELAELKLLVDSVQSAKFITAKKSNELIKKIEGLASKYEASQLHRQVFVTGRVKTMKESIYYNVDRIHTAIAENSRITFQYFQWNVDKKMELRHDGGDVQHCFLLQIHGAFLYQKARGGAMHDILNVRHLKISTFRRRKPGVQPFWQLPSFQIL